MVALSDTGTVIIQCIGAVSHYRDGNVLVLIVFYIGFKLVEEFVGELFSAIILSLVRRPA